MMMKNRLLLLGYLLATQACNYSQSVRNHTLSSKKQETPLINKKEATPLILTNWYRNVPKNKHKLTCLPTDLIQLITQKVPYYSNEDLKTFRKTYWKEWAFFQYPNRWACPNKLLIVLANTPSALSFKLETTINNDLKSVKFDGKRTFEISSTAIDHTPENSPNLDEKYTSLLEGKGIQYFLG